MESSPFVLGTPKRVVLSSVDNHNGSPISPMANLKLLTKVATSYMDENSAELVAYPSRLKRTPVKNKRQLRSLGYICKKFLDLYNLNIQTGHFKQISLGNLTVLLDIEKRRVYDIINIIASLRYASKVGKDKYSWHGDQNLISTLQELRALALNKNYHLLLQKCLNNNFTSDNYFVPKLGDVSFENSAENEESQFFDVNRIGALCRKSMMLFLIAPKGEPLNFKIISHIILPKDVQDKTGMRRLYDISNVLEALGLIKRCDSKHMKRPTFVYSGPILPDGTEYQSMPGSMLADIEHLSDTSSDSYESKLSNIFDFVTTEICELEKQSQYIKEDSVHSTITSVPNEINYVEKQNQYYRGDNQPTTITAKKQLFPELNLQPVNGFIKAPQSSFKFKANNIVKKDITKSENGKLETQPFLAPAFTSHNIEPKSHSFTAIVSPYIKAHNPVIRVNKIARPITVYRFPSVQNSIQNGAIYKAVRQGNIINFVPLKTAH